MKKTKIALKPYLDTITGYCDTLSNEELADIVVNLAKDIPTAGRIEFLDKFESYLPGRRRKSATKPKADPVEQILSDIEALKESIAERIESIEDGSYWDDPDDWDHDGYYDDEGPESIGDDHSDELVSYFEIAADMFLDDNLRDAREVYAALFAMIEEIDEHEYLSLGFEFDIREARARYCRCVYETSDRAKRIDDFAANMETDVHSPYDANQYDENYPLLQDVIDAKPGKMRDMESFLPAWKRLLAKKGLNARPAVLLLEAVNQLEGIGGVAKLARKWKNTQPQGYLYWLDLLKQEKDDTGIIKVSKEGLKVLEEGRYREHVAEFLIDAAVELKNPQNLLFGKRERLFSHAADQNLLDLVDEAIVQDVRDTELHGVIQFFKSIKSEDSDPNALYIRTLLMSGKLNDAYSKVRKDKSVGWSYGSNAGMVFGSILSMVADHPEEAGTINTLLRAYANKTSVYAERIIVEDGTGATFYEEIVKGLKQKRFTKAKKAEYLAWAERIGKNRIDHIVSNMHRRAYGRAAQVLGSLAETYAAMGQESKAQTILRKYYAEKYSRFSAFRREVKAVVEDSKLLRKLGFLT